MISAYGQSLIEKPSAAAARQFLGVAGTNSGGGATVAQVNAAQATANSALSGVNSVFPIAVAGTNNANAAVATANAAATVANSAQTTANAAQSTASAAQSTANSAISGVNSVYPIAVAGTNLAQTAYNIATAGGSAASAYALASIGTNVGTNALNAAAAAQATGNSAISGVTSVYSIASIGTNVGTNALNAAAAAQATGNSAISGVNSVYPIAVAGTNLATAGSNLAQAAYLLAVRGTSTIEREMVLCSAFTPSGIGPDPAELMVPFAYNGVTIVNYSVNRISFRVGTAGGSPTIYIEKSTGTGAFSGLSVGTVVIISGSYEGSAISSLGSVLSGDKLRFNVSSLGTAQNWMVQVGLNPM